MNTKKRDAIAAALIHLAKEIECEYIYPNDGDIGSILTCDGQHGGLSASEVRDLAAAILDRGFYAARDKAEDMDIHTADGKREFIDSLLEGVRADLMSRVPRMPEGWNGIELRQLIARHFNQCVRADLMRGKRGRDFANTVLVENL